MDILSPDQRLELIRRLLIATERKKVEWTQAGNEFNFMSKMGDYGFHLLSRDNDDVAPFQLRLLERPSEEATSPTKYDVIESDEDFDANDDLARLYAMVKREALGVDEIAAQLFRELDELMGDD